MSQLSKRLDVLEAEINPSGPIITIWAMWDAVTAMTEQEIEEEIARRKAAGAPANARFIPARWMTADDQ